MLNHFLSKIEALAVTKGDYFDMYHMKYTPEEQKMFGCEAATFWQRKCGEWKICKMVGGEIVFVK